MRSIPRRFNIDTALRGGLTPALSFALLLSVALACALDPRPVTANDDANGAKDPYMQSCANCHGVNGAGKGPAADLYPVAMPDFTDGAYMSRLSDDYLFDIIKKGGEPVGKSPYMPGFGAALTDTQINELVDYIRSFAK